MKLTRATKALFVVDSTTTFLVKPLGSYPNAQIISSAEELSTVLSTPMNFDCVFILVELDWQKEIAGFYGYVVAKQLMLSSNLERKFDLLFISAFRRDVIYKIFKHSNRIFTQKFDHLEIVESFQLKHLRVRELSDRKFNYLKNYCLLESGILDRLEHDVRGVLQSSNENDIQHVIEDISVHSGILSPSLIEELENFNKITDLEQKRETLSKIYRQLQKLQLEQDAKIGGDQPKFDNQIMVVEDDEETLEKLCSQLSQYFTDIKPFNSGSKAIGELEVNGRSYDAVITDMELLEGDFDDEVQGIDLLEYCDRKYPHITTRIITGLPKIALKNLTGKELDEIVFKGNVSESQFIIQPFDDPLQFAKKIHEDALTRRNIKGPKGSWWPHLKIKFDKMRLQDQSGYDAIWEAARVKAKEFINNDLDELSKVSTTFVRSRNVNGAFDKIELLLTHRLIVLGSLDNSNSINFYDKHGECFVKSRGFSTGMETKQSKAYFNTLLGFSVEGTSETRRETHSCTVIIRDLFVEEWNWLRENRKEILANTTIKQIDEHFFEWLEDLNNYLHTEKLDHSLTFGDIEGTFTKLVLRISGTTTNQKEIKEITQAFYGHWLRDNTKETAIPLLDEFLDKIEGLLSSNLERYSIA